ncbi:MAG: TIGR00730 family Rossman fold protein [Corynebacterium sp.]|nr:TIGR00730 family Rossman fold protein [Corynebacterium sp.]
MTFKFDIPEVDGLSVRIMTAEDAAVRAQAYLRILNRLTDRYVLADVTAESPFAPYLTFDPQRGDIGLILEDEQHQPVASMWVAFIKASGFIAESVPEMVVSVDPTWRGKGLGGWLVKQAINYGRTHGWQGISVSVEPESPARRLYARNEFVTQNANDIMLRTLSPLIKAVAVYCGSVVGERPEYAEAAAALGTELANRGITMVYGGASVGLMGEAASACLAAGGEVIGVMPRDLADLELAHSGLSRLELTDNILARKTRMEELADAFVALPGGMGTLEEVSEVLVRQQLGPYTGPVALLNVEDYWSPLLQALRAMGEEGFIWERYLDAIVVADSIDGLFTGFNNWANPGLKWRKGGLRSH